METLINNQEPTNITSLGQYAESKMENKEAMNYPLNIIKDENILFSISKKHKIEENKRIKDFEEKKKNKKKIKKIILSIVIIMMMSRKKKKKSQKRGIY